MSTILPFRKPPTGKRPGNTLCRNNHHKWVLLSNSRFDTKQGRLVTTWECSRCGKRKNKAI